MCVCVQPLYPVYLNFQKSEYVCAEHFPSTVGDEIPAAVALVATFLRCRSGVIAFLVLSTLLIVPTYMLRRRFALREEFQENLRAADSSCRGILCTIADVWVMMSSLSLVVVFMGWRGEGGM